jgi:DNA-binding NarL/FixJ family response regulator
VSGVADLGYNPPLKQARLAFGPALSGIDAMTCFLIVDDHPLFREALQAAVRMVHADAEVFEATSIEGAIDVADAHKDLDLALLDLSLPGTTGFGGLVRFRSAHPKLPVVVVSGHEEPDLMAEAMSLGIAGYIPKSTSRRELSDAIAEVLNGSVYVPPEMRAKLAERAPETEQKQILKKLRTLTPQQLLVLEMISSGLQNKQIAYDLKLAETTVKAHVSEILRQLEVFTRTRAVIEVAKVDFSALRAPSTDEPARPHIR